MKEHAVTNHIASFRRSVAVLVALTVLLCVLLPGLFILSKADHHCEGEQCPVCESIRLCVKQLRQTAPGFFTQSVPVLSTILVLLFVLPAFAAFLQTTPVSRKVRLNN